MNRKLPIFAFLLAFVACQPQEYNQDLIRIENIIQSEPKQALNELYLLPDSFEDEADRGLYSLLYSMALDKNYIDVKDDSIIAPAVNYYKKRRDNYHVFLSLYYQGRVYENAESYDKALFSYLKAEELLGNSVPDEYSVRLFSAKERVYCKQLAMDKALEEARKAQRFSYSLANPAFYIRSSLDVISLLNYGNNKEDSSNQLDSLKLWMSSRDVQVPSDYYRLLLYKKILYDDQGSDSLMRCRELYCDACESEGRQKDTLLLADILVKMNDFDNAREMLKRVHLLPGASISDSINYYSTATSVYKGLKEFDDYVTSVQESRRLVESKSMSIFNNDVRFLEERYNNMLELEKKRRNNAILIISLFSLIAITVWWINRNVQIRREIVAARNEYAFIKDAFMGATDSPSGVKERLKVRMQALSPYFLSDPAKPFGRKELIRLKRDNSEMLRSIGLIYALSFPAFVSNLVQYDLNSEEIGLCSLYASGFVTKELSDMIDKGSIYRINTSIRTKLGDAVAGRTLPSWLRDLFRAA